jgi:hypothetical protein
MKCQLNLASESILCDHVALDGEESHTCNHSRHDLESSILYSIIQSSRENVTVGSGSVMDGNLVDSCVFVTPNACRASPSDLWWL